MIKDKEYHKKYREEYKETAKYVTVSIPIAEYKKFEKIAKSEGVKVSTVIKNMLVKHINKEVFVPKEILDQLREFTFLVRSIANNVNQIAYHSNMIKNLTEREELNLLMELKKLEDTVKRFYLK